MSSILDFLREDFSILEKLDRKNLDDLMEKIRLYRLNPSRSDAELNVLIAETTYAYYFVGKKIAQVQAIRDKLKREMDLLLYEQSLIDNKVLNYNNKKSLEGSSSYSSEEYSKTAERYDKCNSMETYLKNAYNTLFMEHYALRNEQTQPLDHHFQIKH